MILKIKYKKFELLSIINIFFLNLLFDKKNNNKYEIIGKASFSLWIRLIRLR